MSIQMEKRNGPENGLKLRFRGRTPGHSWFKIYRGFRPLGLLVLFSFTALLMQHSYAAADLRSENIGSKKFDESADPQNEVGIKNKRTKIVAEMLPYLPTKIESLMIWHGDNVPKDDPIRSFIASQESEVLKKGGALDAVPIHRLVGGRKFKKEERGRANEAVYLTRYKYSLKKVIKTLRRLKFYPEKQISGKLVFEQVVSDSSPREVHSLVFLDDTTTAIVTREELVKDCIAKKGKTLAATAEWASDSKKFIDFSRRCTLIRKYDPKNPKDLLSPNSIHPEHRLKSQGFAIDELHFCITSTAPMTFSLVASTASPRKAKKYYEELLDGSSNLRNSRSNWIDPVIIESSGRLQISTSRKKVVHPVEFFRRVEILFGKHVELVDTKIKRSLKK